MINVLKSVTRVATQIAVDIYDRVLNTGFVALVSEQFTPQRRERKGDIEFWTAFPEMEEWVADRGTQEVHGERMPYVVRPYHITYSIDRFEQELSGDTQLIRDPTALGRFIGRGFARGIRNGVLDPMRLNLPSYDGQDFFDASHVHPNDKTFANLMTGGRAVADTPTVDDARRELEEAWARLTANRIPGLADIYEAGEISNLLVIVRSHNVWLAYNRLLREERIATASGGTEINRFRGGFRLWRDSAPAAGTENAVDFIWMDPEGGSRPTFWLQIDPPTPVVPLKPIEDRSERFILIGSDAKLSFATGFPQTAFRIEQN